jgi:3-isopropylmalate/(R)-2-methylmalate dehydratase small subunit
MITGKVWRFGDDINTDLMLPGAVMSKTEAEQARAVFAANRPGWIDQMKEGDVIVAGRNFGMGSNRPAARSLRNIGVGFLLAESINGLFFRNSVNYGFLALECPGCAAAFDEGDTAEFDLDGWRVRNPRTGVVLAPPPVPASLMSLMRGGGIFPLMEREGLIAPRANAASPRPPTA